jgi:hypothetical protein
LKYKPEIVTELLRFTVLFTAEVLNQATSPTPGGVAPLTSVQLPAVLKSEPVLFQSVSPSTGFGAGVGVGFLAWPRGTDAVALAEGAGLAVAEGEAVAVGLAVGAGVGVGFPAKRGEAQRNAPAKTSVVLWSFFTGFG